MVATVDVEAGQTTTLAAGLTVFGRSRVRRADGRVGGEEPRPAARVMGRHLGGAAFPVATVAGTVSEVAVSGDTVAWISRSGDSVPASPRRACRGERPHATQDAAQPSESRDRLLLLLLVELWALNVADLALTRYSLWLGFATGVERIMDYFLRAGTVPALAFKVGIVTVGALLLWRLRVYRGRHRRGGAAGRRARGGGRLPGVLGAQPALSVPGRLAGGPSRGRLKGRGRPAGARRAAPLGHSVLWLAQTPSGRVLSRS